MSANDLVDPKPLQGWAFSKNRDAIKKAVNPKIGHKRHKRHMLLSQTYHLTQGWHGGCGAFSVVSILWLIEVAALVIHAAALEFAEEVKEAVFSRGVTAQLLQRKQQISHFKHKERLSYLPSACFLIFLFFAALSEKILPESEATKVFQAHLIMMNCSYIKKTLCAGDLIKLNAIRSCIMRIFKIASSRRWKIIWLTHKGWHFWRDYLDLHTECDTST